jgi:hypothetical protein
LAGSPRVWPALGSSRAIRWPCWIGQREGRYRDGYAGSGRLLQAVGETSHRSCVLLTSREAPPELAVLNQA